MKMIRYTALAFVACFLAAAINAPAEAQFFKKKATPTFVPSTAVSFPAPAAPVEQASDGPKKPGPVFCAVVRMHLRKEFRKQGMGLIESVVAANQASDAVIAGLIPDAEKVAGVKLGAIGDGKIIDAILDFFKSPEGQQLIAALIKMLIALISGL